MLGNSADQNEKQQVVARVLNFFPNLNNLIQFI